MTVATADDATLISRWQQRGDRQAFAELFNRHRDAVYRTAVVVAGKEAAEDILQRVFLELLQGKAQYRERGSSLRVWLLGVTVRTARHQFRTTTRRSNRENRVGREKSLSSLSPSGSEPSPGTAQEIKEQVLLELARLPDSYRRALELRFLEGLSVQDSAVALQVKTDAMQKRILRGIEKLRERMMRSGFAATEAACLAVLEEISRISVPSSLAELSHTLPDLAKAYAPGNQTGSGSAARGWKKAPLKIALVLIGATAFAVGAQHWYSPRDSAPTHRPEQSTSAKNTRLIAHWDFTKHGLRDLEPVVGTPKWIANKYLLLSEEKVLLKLPLRIPNRPIVITIRFSKALPDATATLGGFWFDSMPKGAKPRHSYHGHNIIQKEQWHELKIYFLDRYTISYFENTAVVGLSRYAQPYPSETIVLGGQLAKIKTIEIRECPESEWPPDLKDPENLVARLIEDDKRDPAPARPMGSLETYYRKWNFEKGLPATFKQVFGAFRIQAATRGQPAALIAPPEKVNLLLLPPLPASNPKGTESDRNPPWIRLSLRMKILNLKKKWGMGAHFTDGKVVPKTRYWSKNISLDPGKYHLANVFLRGRNGVLVIDGKVGSVVQIETLMPGPIYLKLQNWILEDIEIKVPPPGELPAYLSDLKGLAARLNPLSSTYKSFVLFPPKEASDRPIQFPLERPKAK